MSEQEIKRLKEQEAEQTAQTPSTRPKRHKHHGRHERPNLFGPILLIGIGLYFLLTNMGIIQGTLHWEVLFSWWPLFFIFIGFNIIAKQLPGALGSLTSGLIGLAAVGTFGGLLIFGTQMPFLGSFTPSPAEIQREQVLVPQGRNSEAVAMTIDLNSAPFLLEALPESNANLVEGVVFTAGGIDVDTNNQGDNVTIKPQEHFGFGHIGPNYTAEHEWQLGLNRNVPLDLALDLSSGKGRLDLSNLSLQSLDVNGSSGAATLTLPNGGDYDMRYDVGSGAVWMTFPSRGQHEFEIDGGSGGLHIILPAQIEARVTVADHGSGAFNISDQFRESNGRGNDMVYMTPNFDEDGAHFIDLTLSIGSGSVSISPEVDN